MKLKVELIIIIVLVLLASCDSWGLFNVPFWLYWVIGAIYLIFDLIGLNEKEL